MVVSLSCESDFSKIRNSVSRGATVIFPTDTVYGLGTNPFSGLGIRKCFELKKRDATKRMPVLVSSKDMADHLVRFEKKSTLLASRFWPGKLTLILPLKDVDLPEELTGSERTVAVRIPDHECCLRLISKCGGALIGTSANISGEDPFTNPNDPQLVGLAQGADYFVSGRCGEGGLSSTIVDATSEDSIRIIREGAVKADLVVSYLENINNTDRS